MAESIQIRKMEPDDMDLNMSLVKSEGWNQTERDWAILLHNPDNICLVALFKNEPVGTACVINYSGEIAWICMVLVKKEFRGRGIGRFLLHFLTRNLEGFQLIGLDATPAGKLMYEKIGFSGYRTILRLINRDFKADFRLKTQNSSVTVQPSVVTDIIAFDKGIYGAERKHLIESLIEFFPDRALVLNRGCIMRGFALGRRGNRYDQIGPVSALSPEEAIILLSEALRHLSGLPVIIDIPMDQAIIIDWLKSAGFIFQRSFERMYLQNRVSPGLIMNQYAIAGPEYG